MVGAHGLELAAFFGFVVFATWLDLFVLQRDDHDISMGEAARYFAGWLTIAMLFGGYVYWRYGPELWMQFIAGYTLEEALSVDNMFVIAMIFSFFGIRGGLQRRALAWGIIGAIVMRGILIFVGVELVQRFTWLLPVFGLFLLITAVKMLRGGDHGGDIAQSAVYRWTNRVVPVYPGFDGNRIVTQRGGRKMLTLLGMSILMVEATDLIFAIDSIPAVMGVSSDPFIILTSNVFAVLGLRSLYFLLAGMLHRFRFLKLGLAVVLGFIGVKMLALPIGVHISIGASVAVVLGVIGAAVAASLLIPERKPEAEAAD